MAPNLFQFQSSKWRDVLTFPKLSDAKPEVEIVLVHDLSNKGGDLQDRLERYISDVCSSAASAAKVSCRIRSYRVDLEPLQRGSFDVEYAGFVKSIQSSLAKSATVLPGTPRSGVIFIAFELGVWVVQKFIYDQWPESDSDNSSSLQGRLTGFFFLRSAKGFEDGSEYTRERLAKVMTSERTSKAVPLRRFSRIQNNFQSLLEDGDGTVVARSTWVLPTPDLESSSPLLSVPGDKADVLKPLNSTLFRLRRLSQRTHHPPYASDPEVDLAERVRAFCKRMHATVTRRDPGEEFNADNDLYINTIKPIAKARKDSISSSTNEASDVSTPQSPQKVDSFDLKDVQNRPAPPSASAMLRPPSAPPARLWVESPQIYVGSGHRTSYFQGVYDGVTDNIAQSSFDAPTFLQSGEPHIIFRSDSGQSGSLSPSTRNKSHQKSMSWKQVLAPEDPIATSVTERIAQYYRAATRGLDDGEFYHKCRSSLFKYHISPLECRIRAREALLLFNKGKCNQSKEALDKLKDEIQNVQKGVSEKGHEDSQGTGPHDGQNKELEYVLLEVRYHWCIVAVRLGEYEAAYDELIHLERRVWFKAIDGILTAPGKVGVSALNDTRFEVVINTNRVLGLLWGIFGHFERAEETISKADSQCSKLLAAGEEAIPMPEPGQFPVDIRTMEMKMTLTRVKLKMLQGHCGDAQTLLLSAIPHVESHFGGGHFLTLEAASLHAAILATLSDETAESICLTTHKATKHHLGEYHPISMEVLGTLADIYLTKSRPYEALDTVHHLRSKARETLKSLKSKHPQVLRFWLQVGEANLSIGNFMKARSELQGLCEAIAERDQTSRHDLGENPETLRYRMKLAMASSCVGKTDEADREAENCLRKQLEIFRSDVNSIVGAGLDQLVQAWLDERDANVVPPFIHPDVLESLVICSSILEKRDPGRELPDAILDEVLKVRESLHGKSHWLNLSIRLELAFNRLEHGAENVEEERELVALFEDIASSCEDALGTAQILTLRAKLGRLFTAVDVSTGRILFRGEASQNLASQVDLMGHCHPMILDSRWRLFVFEVLVWGDDDAHIAGAQLLGALRLEEVRRERLMESLQLEEKIAAIYSIRLHDYERGLPILIDMMEYCFLTNETGFDVELETFCRGAFNLTCEAIGLSAKMLKKRYDVLNEKSRGALECMDTFLELAHEIVRQTDNTQSRVEGLTLVGRQLQQIAYIESSDQSERLTEKMRHAFSDWQQIWKLEVTTGLGIDSGHTPKRKEKKSRGKGKGERRSQIQLSGYSDDREGNDRDE